MLSVKRKQEERYPYFLAIQITVVELPCEFSYLFGGLTLIHVLIFCFTVIIIFFKVVHISRARDLGKEIWR